MNTKITSKMQLSVHALYQMVFMTHAECCKVLLALNECALHIMLNKYAQSKTQSDKKTEIQSTKQTYMTYRQANRQTDRQADRQQTGKRASRLSRGKKLKSV